MLGYNFEYRGQSFSDDDFDKSTGKGIILQRVRWAEVVTDDDQVPIQGFHGLDVSPTLYRGRLIEIEGLIINESRSERQPFRDIIDETFKLEPDPSPSNRGFYDFVFLDDDGTKKVISAKVLNTPSYNQPELGEFGQTSFRVQLIAERPNIDSFVLNSSPAVEGFFGGVTLDTELPVALDDYGYSTELNNLGNWPAGLKTTIVASGTTGGNMRIINTETGEYIGVQTPLSNGDVLVIDTDNAIITVNGVDFTADRIAGSNFLYVDPAGSQFTVLDDLSRLGDGLNATVTFEWYNTWV